MLLHHHGKRTVEHVRPISILDELDESEVDITFNVLMGDKVEPRKKFIEENAKFVKNLDI